MARSASVSALGSEFDDFLFAPIGEDRNGMLLSVLSEAELIPPQNRRVRTSTPRSAIIAV
jgi:hypothetical protein